MTPQSIDTEAIRDAVALLTGRLRSSVDPLFALRLDGVREAWEALDADECDCLPPYADCTHPPVES